MDRKLILEIGILILILLTFMFLIPVVASQSSKGVEIGQSPTTPQDYGVEIGISSSSGEATGNNTIFNITYQNFAYNQSISAVLNSTIFNITYQNFAYNMTSALHINTTFLDKIILKGYDTNTFDLRSIKGRFDVIPSLWGDRVFSIDGGSGNATFFGDGVEIQGNLGLGRSYSSTEGANERLYVDGFSNMSTVQTHNLSVGRPYGSLASLEIEPHGSLNTGILIRDDNSPSTSAIENWVQGSLFKYYSLRTDGLMFWGNGSSAVDTNLYRDNPSLLQTDDDFRALGRINSSIDVCITGGNCLSSAGANSSRFNISYSNFAYNQTQASGWTKIGTNVILSTITDKVGIGIATPLSTLQITGNVSISENLTVGNFVFGNKSNVGIGNVNPTYTLQVQDSVVNSINLTGALYINGLNKSVGIGTVSPNTILHILGASDQALKIQTSGTSSIASLTLQNPAVIWNITVEGDDEFRIRLGATEVFLINEPGGQLTISDDFIVNGNVVTLGTTTTSGTVDIDDGGFCVGDGGCTSPTKDGDMMIEGNINTANTGVAQGFACFNITGTLVRSAVACI